MGRALSKEPPLLIRPSLAVKIGLKEAIILQQIQYWLDSKRNNHFYEDRYWVHNTYEEWQQQFPFWASRTIQRAICRLEDLGLLISHISREFKKTKFYSVNYEQLESLSVPSKNTNKTMPVAPSRQDDSPPKSMCPAQRQVVLEESSPNISQSQSIVDNSLSSQSVQQKRTSCPRSRQGGAIHHDKVARSYIPYTETTTETTLPPLTPPSSDTLCLRQEEEKDLKKMFRIWDETVYQILNPGKCLHLTDQRKALMHKLLKSLFDGKVEAWEDYCQSVAGCPFLMGQNEKAFRVTLDWALSPSNALKVLENDFYSKPVEGVSTVKEQPWDEYAPLLKAELKDWPYAEEWLQICEALVKHLGQITFNVWFRQVRPKEIKNKSICLLVPNSFTKDYILREFTPSLKTCVTAVYPLNTFITIEVDANIVTTSSLKPTKGESHE